MLAIIADSHVDHGINGPQMEWVLSQFTDKVAFFIATLELPEELGTVPCGLHGPVMGQDPIPESEVHHKVRGDRPCTSRLIDRPVQQTRKVTVIAGPTEGHDCVLYTAYGGPLAPREPGDPTLPEEDREESEKFWAEHALST